MERESEKATHAVSSSKKKKVKLLMQATPADPRCQLDESTTTLRPTTEDVKKKSLHRGGKKSPLLSLIRREPPSQALHRVGGSARQAKRPSSYRNSSMR